MPRGMNRTTIMSHGAVHDAKGVTGTHIKGTVPAPEVLDAIPASIGAVGNVPETALAGRGPTTRAQVPGAVNTTKKRWTDDEGNPDFPPRGMRGGPSTQRPGPETTTAEATPAEAPAEPAGSSILPPPEAVAEQERDELSDDETPTPVTGTAALPAISKRQLQRATVEKLREWCGLVGIIPEEYVEDGEEVTGVLMRQLLSQKLDLDL